MFEALINKFERLATIDQNQIIHDILENMNIQQEIIRLNKEQLLEGKGADFNDLPKYIDDPFFKTIKAAKAYQKFKEKISPNPHGVKPIGVMDFYITGEFHNSIKVINSLTEFKLVSDSDIAQDVQFKTGGQALGLSSESLDMFFIPLIKNIIIEKIKERLAA